MSRGRHTCQIHRDKMFMRGTDNHSSKLNVKKVREIRRLFAKRNLAYSDLAKRYGVIPGSIKKVIERDTWRHVK